MKMPKQTKTLFLLILLTHFTIAETATITGKWFNEKKGYTILIESNNDQFTGFITDAKDHSHIGKVFLKNFRLVNGAYIDGKMIHPVKKKSFDATITQKNRDSFTVTANILFVKKRLTWQRIGK